MHILSQTALSNTEYLGCLSAFWSAFGNALGSSENYLVRLAGRRKGSHFGWEMSLDQARYGALIVLERWKELNERFRESLQQSESWPLAEGASRKCEAAAGRLESLYARLDELEDYSEAAVREALEQFREITAAFHDERQAAAGAAEIFAEKETADPPGLLPVVGDAPSTPAQKFREFREQFLIELSRR